MVTRLKNLPAWHIIWVLTLLGFLLGVILGQEEYLTASRRPVQLEPLRVAAVRFHSFATSFFHVRMFVETANEQIYSAGLTFGSDVRLGAWELDEIQLEEIDLGRNCSETIVERFEQHTSTLSECHTFEVPAEWCPGRIASFAIDSQGNVWHTSEPKFCFLAVLFGGTLVAVVGFAFGIILVSLRRLLIKTDPTH